MFALNEGDAIRGDASVASKVDYTLHGIIGTTIKQLADGQLASSEGNLYTATTDGIAVTAICLVNTDSSARTVNLYLKPKGGTSRRVVPKDISLSAGYCMYANGVEIKIVDTSGQEQTSAIALDDTPVDGQTQEAITSNWAYDHNVATTGVHGAGANTLLHTGDVDDTPVNGATTAPVSSNWAYDTAALLDDASQSVVTGSRALDQVYTNGTKIRLVAVTITATTDDAYYRSLVYCDATDGATTPIICIGGKVEAGADHPYSCATFVVPPGYKYKVTTAADNETLTYWVETDLL